MKKLIVASSLVIAGLTAGGTAFGAYAGGHYTGGSSADQQGIYVQGSAGGNYLMNQVTNELEYKWGWNAGGAIGYQMGPWRAAFAVDYLDNDFDTFDISTIHGNSTSLSASDDARVWTFMANGYYDIHMDSWPVVPYVGIGIGAINIDTRFSNSELTNNVDSFPTGSENDTVFGYQGILGLAYPINNFRIFGEYRNVNSTSYKLVDRDGTKVEDYYHNNLLNVGVSYLFSMA